MFDSQDPQQQKAQRKRMMWAVALAALILILADVASSQFTGKPAMSSLVSAPEKTAAETVPLQGVPDVPNAGVVSATQAMRLPLESARFTAQVNLTGGTLDRMTLKNYAETKDAPNGYALLKDSGVNLSYVESGWLGNGLAGPGSNAQWQAEVDVNGAGKPLVLVWRNDSGQAFQRIFTPQADGYTITVTDRVYNSAALPVTFSHYAQVQQADGYRPHEKSNFVNYFGPMGWMASGEDMRLVEEGFADVKDDGKSATFTGTGGWWGVTSQYFIAAILPGAAETQRDFRYASANGRDFYTATVQHPSVTVPAGGQAEVTYTVYAGPKSMPQLTAEGHGLEQAISWGWFEPLVKGMYHVLAWLHDYLGNWGLAIIALTLLLKIVTFPLANKSYHSMARMKKLQPKIEALKAQSKDSGNQQEMAMRMMQLYKEEKVNPMGGCWPMLVQIPIFFAMYKVVLVTFEFRHAPLGLWIHDMSAMDPYFVLPVLMGASMWVQMRLQPKATDPMQAAVFRWMPVLFTVMFLFFPAGLVLYWLTNNVLSIMQQYIILKQEKAV